MNKVVWFPGDRYDDVKTGKINKLFTTHDTCLPVQINDCIPCVFKDLKDNMLLEITDFGYKNFNALTENDARECGFNNVSELKKELLDKYVTLDNYSRLYYYTFIVIGVSEKVGE